jgi:hypothetical protein
VEGVVEAHGGDRRARDRGQKGAAQAVAERMAEARLEGRNCEALPVALGFAERLHGRALDHQHVRRLPLLPEFLFGVDCAFIRRAKRNPVYLE